MDRILRRARSLGWRLNNIHRREAVVTVRTSLPKKGDVLLSYMTAPVRSETGADLFHQHSNFWECRQIARTFLQAGFDVDVIESDNLYFVPRKDYSVFVEHRSVLARVWADLRPGCIKVSHLDTAHPIFNNFAEAERLLELLHRRGAALPARRTLPLSLAYEHADRATMLGNRFTLGTYPKKGREVFRTPISVPVQYDWPEARDLDASRRRFLWIGSGGLVHKGLDLVLEAFAAMPEMELVICGPITVEPEFTREFDRELTRTPNIKVAGWVDTNSRAFLDIAVGCIAVISASCSEGGCGAVLTAVHAGLIPLVNPESSVDVGQFGVMLSGSTVIEIIAAVRALSGLSLGELEARARAGWEYVRQHHTRQRFADSYRTVVHKLLGRDGTDEQAPQADVETFTW